MIIPEGANPHVSVIIPDMIIMDNSISEENFKRCTKCGEPFHDSLRLAKKHLLYKCREAYPDNLEVHKILKHLQDKNDYIKPVNNKVDIKLRSDLY